MQGVNALIRPTIPRENIKIQNQSWERKELTVGAKHNRFGSSGSFRPEGELVNPQKK